MPNDSVPSAGLVAFFKRIWSDPVWSKVISTIIIAIPTGLLYLVKLKWAILFLVAVVWLFFLWACKSKRKTTSIIRTDSSTENEGIPRFTKRWRRAFFIGIIALPILTLITAYLEHRPSNKLIVLVADFQGPDQKYAVTPTVINKLRRATEEFSEVEIEALRMTITEQEGSAISRKIGRERKASIVIWGFYDDALTGTVHIEMLSEQRPLLNKYGRSKNGDQLDYSASVASKPGLTVKENIAGDMSLITLLLLGFIRYESEDYDGAILRFSKALEQKTSSQVVDYQASLLAFRGNSFHYKGDINSAIADYSKAIELKLDVPEVYYDRGVAYHYKGQLDQAITDYTKSIELKPNVAACYSNRGAAYNEKGQLDHAMADYTKAIELKPDHVDAYNNRGVAYHNKGQFDLAINALTRAIELKPGYSLAYINRGNAYRHKGQLDLAIADYTKAIDLKLDIVAAYNSRGTAYYDKNQVDLAIADYSKVIELRPDYAEAYINRGNAYCHKEQFDQGIADFSKAIELRPDAEIYYNRGLANQGKRQFDRAIADYTKAIELKPNMVAAYNSRGVANSEKGQLDRAIADYTKTIQLRSDHIFAYNNRGNAYRSKGQLDRAIADYAKAIEFKPDYAEAHYNRGIANEMKNNNQSAITDFQRSFDLFSDIGRRKAVLDKLRSLGAKAK